MTNSKKSRNYWYWAVDVANIQHMGWRWASENNSQKVLSHLSPVVLPLLPSYHSGAERTHLLMSSFYHSFYNYILCPGIVTGAEHTQVRNTQVPFLWFSSEEIGKQIL